MGQNLTKKSFHLQNVVKHYNFGSFSSTLTLVEISKISKISDLILLQWEPCAICGMRFPFSEDLDTHVKLDHSKKSALEKPSVCCQFCGKKFITPDYMYRHAWKKHARQAQGKCTNIVLSEL